jgi:hypothetical protein
LYVDCENSRELGTAELGVLVFTGVVEVLPVVVEVLPVVDEELPAADEELPVADEELPVAVVSPAVDAVPSSDDPHADSAAVAQSTPTRSKLPTENIMLFLPFDPKHVAASGAPSI